MIEAPVRGRWVSLLRASQARLASRLTARPREDRAATHATVAANRFTWPVLFMVAAAATVMGIELWHGMSAQHRSPLVPEAVYLGTLVVVACARASQRAWSILALATLGVLLCILLDTLIGGDLGNIGLYAIIATVVYRLPSRLSLPIFAACAAVILTSEGLFTLLMGGPPINQGVLISQGIIIGFAYAASRALRSRHLLITQLEQTQAQLRREMARTAELAAARERARIARDIHDVLAHSLTVLSIQTQALRQLVHNDPDRSAALLDQMAEVLRESQLESRQMVGLLREAIPDEENANVALRLRVTAERFAERTGVRCTLHEHGEAARLSPQQVEALRFALQEALTNAYRHGQAAHAEADLWWESATVRLSVRNDGAAAATAADTSGHGHGLRGMRERATALAGTVTTGAAAHGSGFEVSMTLPLTSAAGTAHEGAAPDRAEGAATPGERIA